MALKDEYLKETFLNTYKKLNRVPRMKETKHYNVLVERFGNGNGWNGVLEYFGLSPYKKSYTKEDLITIMQNWYDKNNIVPTTRHFNGKDVPDSTTYTDKFNKKWSEIVKDILNLETRPGLPKYDYSESELLEMFKCEYYRINPISKAEFEKKRKNIPSVRFYLGKFKSWNNLKKKAKIDRSSIRRSENECVKIIESIITKLGYVPNSKEFSKYAKKHVFRKLGPYNKILIKLGYEPAVPTPIKVKETPEELLNMYINFCRKKGFLVGTTEINNSKEIYNTGVLVNRFGSINELKKQANKILGFDDQIFESNTKYTKQEMEKLLLNEYKEKGRILTIVEINKNPNLPSASTITKYFKTTKMMDVWNEVLKK